ncbi:hypothetical protein O3M35_002338 [Rhynocoris fuscipes]|uniref:Uncharacterized protein n=1 Tax=Rhynocoris fuscipes TaxID=488301 RepID=A0AAW1CP21_9HEMI
MDFSVNEVLPSGNMKWQCPECQKRGQYSSVRLFQANFDSAIYFCENKNCLYPHETGSPSKYVVRRSVDDIPVNADMLKSLQLPETLLTEPTLRTAHLDQLIWLSAFHPHIKTAIEVDRQWKIFMANVIKLNGIVDNQLDKIKDFYDPDLEKLKGFSDELVKFGKHIVPDLEEIMQVIRS